MEEPNVFKRYREGIVIGVLACIAFAGISILADFHSPLFWPLFYALIAAGIVAISGIAIVLLKRVPRPLVLITERNIESCIRSWLDTHRVMVKNDPCSDAYFRLRIVINDKHMTIIRSKSEYQEYVEIVANLGMGGENDRKIRDKFSNDEFTDMLVDMKVFLAQAKVGYSGLIDPPENFQVFRRVPIYPNLTEFAFMSMVNDVEAAMNLVGMIFLKHHIQADKRLQGAAPSLLVSDADTATLEPPTA
jgi:hypothetical protein